MKKLRNANKDCLVCDEPIEGFLPAVPIVCPKVLFISSTACLLICKALFLLFHASFCRVFDPVTGGGTKSGDGESYHTSTFSFLMKWLRAEVIGRRYQGGGGVAVVPRACQFSLSTCAGRTRLPSRGCARLPPGVSL